MGLSKALRYALYCAMREVINHYQPEIVGKSSGIFRFEDFAKEDFLETQENQASGFDLPEVPSAKTILFYHFTETLC
jgi:hypothetical protein